MCRRWDWQEGMSLNLELQIIGRPVNSPSHTHHLAPRVWTEKKGSRCNVQRARERGRFTASNCLDTTLPCGCCPEETSPPCPQVHCVMPTLFTCICTREVRTPRPFGLPFHRQPSPNDDIIGWQSVALSQPLALDHGGIQ